jgi:hypothetical protein
MATLTTEQVTSSGLNPAVNSAGASGDKVRPDSILRVINANAGTVTVTLDTKNPGTVDGNVVPDKSISIPTGQFRYIFVSDFYRNKADSGLALVTCSPNASVTIEVIKS